MKTKLFFFLILMALVSCNNTPKELYRIQENGLYGFVDSTGNVIISPQYKYASGFYDGLSCIITDIKMLPENILTIKYGYINTKNKLVIDTSLVIELKQNEIIPNELKLDDPLNIISKFNSNELPFRYSLMDELKPNNNRILYQDTKNKKMGYLDYNGKIAINAQYITAKKFRDSLAVVQLSYNGVTDIKNAVSSANYYGVIDVNNNEIIKAKYFEIQDYYNGKTWARTLDLDFSKGKTDVNINWYLLDKNGKVTIGPLPGMEGAAYYYPYSPDNVCIESMKIFDKFFYLFINEKGNFFPDYDKNGSAELGKETFDMVTIFSEGVAGIRYVDKNNKNKWALVDKEMNVLALDYDSVGLFSEGLIPIWKLSDFYIGNWGYVNRKFEEVIPFEFNECSSFDRGLAYFNKKGDGVMLEGYINKKGNIVWQTTKKIYN